MKTLLPFLKKYKLECIAAPLLKLFETLMELTVPLVMASLIDVGIANRDSAYALRMGGILIALGFFGMLFAFTAQYFAAKAAVGTSAGLRGKLFAHIQTFSYSQLDTLGTPTLITRMTADANLVQSGVNMALRLMLRSPFVVFGAMIMAFTVDSTAAWVFVALIPLLTLVVVLIMSVTLPGQKNVQKKLDTVLLRTRENLTGVRVLRAFNKQADETAAYEEANDELVKKQIFLGRVSGLLNPLTYVLVNLALAVLLWVGAIRVNAGMSQGSVVALVNYLSQILVELVKLANLIVTITKGLAGADRIGDILAIEPDLTCPQADDAPEDAGIAYENVCMSYPGSAESSLSGITFSAKAGQTVGIIGGTGSGKSTLVSLLPRFYDAASGCVRIGGRDVRTLSEETLQRMVSVVPQKAVLFKGTIRENMLWGNNQATDEEIWQALERAQAADFVRNTEKGLDSPVEQNGRNLSGGQKQRLTIARALLKNAPILILDDSSSALDFATEAALRKAIATLPQKPTTLIVSQRAASLLHADLILVLEDGMPVGAGTHSQLLESCPVYQEIYYSQFPKEANA